MTAGGSALSALLGNRIVVIPGDQRGAGRGRHRGGLLAQLPEARPPRWISRWSAIPTAPGTSTGWCG